MITPDDILQERANNTDRVRSMPAGVLSDDESLVQGLGQIYRNNFVQREPLELTTEHVLVEHVTHKQFHTPSNLLVSCPITIMIPDPGVEGTVQNI